MFKVPSTIPQDLLLIHDLVSDPPSGPSNVHARPREHAQDSQTSSDSIASSSESESSDSGTDSEEVDVVENLLTKTEETEAVGDTKAGSPSPSSSETSSDDSDTNSDSEPDGKVLVKASEKQHVEDFDEDEDEGCARASGTVMRTKNEIPETSVVMPDITEIDAQEPLEKVGEIMSIIQNTIVVKGLSSENENKASLRALDSESLLVFGDRKVLGYVYETFGPTHQPLYQVKFPSANAIDRDLVTISREVFHVPPRSHFVFPSQLAKTKGSDASNVYDEEVNEDEVEFSDDEAEAAFRRQRKQKRDGQHESSAASSRFSTPTPSQMRDQDLNADSFYGASPFDEYGPYDVGVAPEPSRPAPLPYDDPYDEDYSPIASHESSTQTSESWTSTQRSPRSATRDDSRRRCFGRGRGQGRGGERGRGRGRDSSRRNTFGSNGPLTNRRDRRPSSGNQDNHETSSFRSVSPTSMAIAQATGVFPDGSPYLAQQHNSSLISPSSPYGTWHINYNQFNASQQHSHGPQQMYQDRQASFNQPHINPRFASLFGIDVNFMQRQQYGAYGALASPLASPYTPYSPNASWTSNNWPQDISAASFVQPQIQNEQNVQTKTRDDEYRP